MRTCILVLASLLLAGCGDVDVAGRQGVRTFGNAFVRPESFGCADVGGYTVDESAPAGLYGAAAEAVALWTRRHPELPLAADVRQREVTTKTQCTIALSTSSLGEALIEEAKLSSPQGFRVLWSATRQVIIVEPDVDQNRAVYLGLAYLAGECPSGEAPRHCIIGACLEEGDCPP